MPFRADDGIYEEGFIEDRRSALEAFINKIAGTCCHQKSEILTNIRRSMSSTDNHIISRASTRPEREMFAHVPPGGVFEPLMVLMQCPYRRRTLTEIMCLARLETPEASLSELPRHCRLPLYSSCSFIAFINHHESTYLISWNKLKSRQQMAISAVFLIATKAWSPSRNWCIFLASQVLWLWSIESFYHV